MIRELRVFTDAEGTILSERRVTGAPGAYGGQPGQPGKNMLIRKGKKIVLPGKTPLSLQAGDIIRVQTPGGGGWGM